MTSVPPISVEEWPPEEAIHIGSMVLLLDEGDKLLTVYDLMPATEGNASDWLSITPTFALPVSVFLVKGSELPDMEGLHIAFELGPVGFTSNKKRPCSNEAVHREVLKTSSL